MSQGLSYDQSSAGVGTLRTRPVSVYSDWGSRVGRKFEHGVTDAVSPEERSCSTRGPDAVDGRVFSIDSHTPKGGARHEYFRQAFRISSCLAFRAGSLLRILSSSPASLCFFPDFVRSIKVRVEPNGPDAEALNSMAPISPHEKLRAGNGLQRTRIPEAPTTVDPDPVSQVPNRSSSMTTPATHENAEEKREIIDPSIAAKITAIKIKSFRKSWRCSRLGEYLVSDMATL
jgi:hypothetical protein